MKILLINKFLYPKGGDAISTLATGKLLSEKGHNVAYWGMKHLLNPEYPYSKYFVDNIDYEGKVSKKQQVSNALKILYSFEAKEKIEQIVNIIKPDIVHLHNFAHQISPSILHIFKKYNISVVMTMHDYKLICASYLMLANGKICQACRNEKYYHCFFKGCVKDSKLKSLLSTLEMYLHHRMLHIYDLVDIFISPSKFLKDKVKEMGFKGKVVHIPNFIHLDDYQPCYTSCERSICYVGRLSKEKGVATLIKAVSGLNIELKIIGDGPIRKELEAIARFDKNSNSITQTSKVRFLGYMSGEQLKEEIKKSLFLVIPSEWYENNPRSVIEAFALGKPVLGARIGGIPELVKDGKTGYTFEPCDADDLRSKIVTMLNDNLSVARMGKAGRSIVEQQLNPTVHYEKLLNVYLASVKHN